MRCLNHYIIILVLIISSYSCKETDIEQLEKNKNFLISSQWSLPRVISGSPAGALVFIDSPTIFNEDGVVYIGNSYEDFYEFRDEVTIRFINTGINWQILNINDSVIHVNMVKMDNAAFIMECMYDSF